MPTRPKSKTRLVLVFGTFDLLHPGHRWFLRRAAQLGQALTVVVARDVNVRKLKHKTPVQNERIRLAAVRQLKYVTRAVLGQREFNHRYAMVRKIKPQIIALGYDQHTRTTSLKRDLGKIGLAPKIVRLSSFHPRLFKSSKLRRVAKVGTIA